jgi:hypothetical protein
VEVSKTTRQAFILICLQACMFQAYFEHLVLLLLRKWSKHVDVLWNVTTECGFNQI